MQMPIEVSQNISPGLPKLVRDLIPEKIRNSGKSCKTRVAAPEEYLTLLADKLVEEAMEFRSSGAIEELADLTEVLRRVMQVIGADERSIAKISDAKKLSNGAFDEMIVLEIVL